MGIRGAPLPKLSFGAKGWLALGLPPFSLFNGKNKFCLTFPKAYVLSAISGVKALWQKAVQSLCKRASKK